MSLEQLAGLATAILGAGGLGAVAVKFFEFRLKSDSANDRVASNMIKTLIARIERLETDHSDCQRQNATLREQVGALREAVARLEGRRDYSGQSCDQPASSGRPDDVE